MMKYTPLVRSEIEANDQRRNAASSAATGHMTQAEATRHRLSHHRIGSHAHEARMAQRHHAAKAHQEV